MGQPYLNIPIKSDKENWDLYHFKYRINNHASTKDQYLIYDVIGMVGSVGGTLGTNSDIDLWITIQFFPSFESLFVSLVSNFYFFLGLFTGFSMTGFVSWIFSYIKTCV